VLADIIEKEATASEKKFLHDYSYNLFEEALIKEQRVLEINQDTIDDAINRVKDFSFVKVVGRVAFNDLKQVEHTIKNFNSIGEALGYISLKKDYDNEVKGLKEQLKAIADRNQKAKAESMLKNKASFKKVLEEKGLQFDEDYLKHLSYMLDYGYNQQFEVQIPIVSNSNEYYLFSAQLDRSNLKDDEYRIIKKFSRETEREFVLFGILTQVQSLAEKKNLLENAVSKVRTDSENANLKEALMNMVALLTNIEKTFTGKLDYEYIIDPISLYLEI
jgi:hypothetical protein